MEGRKEEEQPGKVSKELGDGKRNVLEERAEEGETGQ